MDQKEWWRATTIYQIYPRSFSDSNGDGIGDIQGIINHLDDLKELGVETLWISPFFTSPGKDFGYDISDYYSIESEYGTLKTVENLIHEVHKRQMYILFDLVLNHTSDQHPWFIESRSSLYNEKRDWYIWRKGKGRKPPNNWRSMVDGSGWHYDKLTHEWYWAAFLSFQPDLNYRNSAVKQEMFNVLRFWLDKGVDGFRLDIIGAVYEDPLLRDNPVSPHFFPHKEELDRLFISYKYNNNHPDNFAFAADLRKIIDEYQNPRRFLIGETFGTPETIRNYCGSKEKPGLHAAFLFGTLKTPLKAKSLKNMISTYEKVFQHPIKPTWVFSNHDRMRYFHRKKGNEKLDRLRLLLQYTLRGIPVLYYGEEIGMTQGKIHPKKVKDPIGRKFRDWPHWLFRLLEYLSDGGLNRDGCRTPMQWSSDKNSGFCNPETQPWIDINPDYTKKNVQAQRENPDSLWNFLKHLLSLRKTEDSLKAGTFQFEHIEDPGLLVYKRSSSFGPDIIIVINFRRKPFCIDKYYPKAELILSTFSKPTGIRKKLPESKTVHFREGKVFRIPPKT